MDLFKLFQIKESVPSLTIQEFSELEKIAQTAEFDRCKLKLESKLLNIFQFKVNNEPGIDKTEQILWQINSLLTAPLENYYYAYQIFQESPEEVLGLACVLEKQKFDESAAPLRSKIMEVSSSDEQFVLLRQKIGFWQCPQFLGKLNRQLLLLGVLCGLVLLVGLAWCAGQELAAREQLVGQQQQLSELEAKLKLAHKIERLKQLKQQSYTQNQLYYQALYKITKVIPEKVYFETIKMEATAEKITITGFTSANYRRLVTFLNQAKKIKDINSIALTKSNSRGARLDYEIVVHLKAKTPAREAAKQTAEETARVADRV